MPTEITFTGHTVVTPPEEIKYRVLLRSDGRIRNSCLIYDLGYNAKMVGLGGCWVDVDSFLSASASAFIDWDASTTEFHVLILDPRQSKLSWCVPCVAISRIELIRNEGK